MFINPSRRRAYVPEWSKRQPRVDNLSYAIASIRLGHSDLAPALWSFVSKDVPEPVPEEVMLASEWLSIFIKDKELTEHSPLFPLGVASQWERLSAMGFLSEERVKRGYTTQGMTRSTWDLLFLAAVTPQSLNALRAVRDAGWSVSEEPAPLSVVTRAMGQVLSCEGLPGPIPHELVLAGLHLAGHKIRFRPDGVEPLIHVATPVRPDGDPDRDLPSLLDEGWISRTPPDVSTNLGRDDRYVAETTHFHLLNAASLLSRADRGLMPGWAPIGTTGLEALQGPADLMIGPIPFGRDEAASGLSRLISAGQIRADRIIPPKPDHFGRLPGEKPGRGSKAKPLKAKTESSFSDILLCMGEGWFDEMASHQRNSHDFSNQPFLPYERDRRDAELLRILTLEGFAISQARLRTDRLMDREDFEARILDHADQEEKADIDDLLQGRRGSVGDPLARFWQALCLMNSGRTVEELGVEVFSHYAGNSEISRLKIDGRLFVSERQPLMNLLSAAEDTGCRGVVSVGESFNGGELVPGSRMRRTRTLSLTCVEVASALTLSHDLFGRFDRTPEDAAEWDVPNP
jgi:hypothetical protein